MKRLTPVLFPLLVLALSPLRAEGETREDFGGGEVPAGWPAAKGEWTVSDGALHGKELAADKHAAVLTIPDPHVSSRIEFRLVMAGAKGFHLSYNHEKGHLFRVRCDGKSVALVLDKDKKDPASKAVVLDHKEIAIDEGREIPVFCRVKGDEVEVRFGDVSLAGKHESLARPKTGYRLIVQGSSVKIDDVVYESVR